METQQCTWIIQYKQQRQSEDVQHRQKIYAFIYIQKVVINVVEYTRGRVYLCVKTSIELIYCQKPI